MADGNWYEAAPALHVLDAARTVVYAGECS
jgi:hypothetical protein